jgi:transcriptional regulator with XRE-family HTH domain
MAATLKDKLRAHRQKLGLSLDDLARLSDSSKSYLWELENRDTRKPSAEKLTKIAEVLQVTTGYLLDEKAEMNEPQVKEAFFRKFSRLDEEDKKRIEDIIDAWGKKK